MQLTSKVFEGFKVARDEKIKYLERVPIFEDCRMRQLRAVADISKVVEIPERTVLTRQGEAGEEFFIIIDGTAVVTVSAQRRHRLRPGEFFGKMRLLDGDPRSATVKAETDLRLLVISRAHFWEVLREVPELTHKMLVTLSTWQRADGGLPDVPVFHLVVDPRDASGNSLHAVTALGVYRTTNGGANWALFGAGLPTVRVMGLWIAPDGGLLRAATYGRGAWEINP